MNDASDNSERTLARRFRQLARREPGTCPDELGLAAYVDGLASEAETARIEAHLAVCRECLLAVADARRLAGRAHAAAPPHVVARARALVGGRGRGASRVRRSPWRAAIGWAATAAAAVAVGFVGLSAGSATHRARQAEPEVALAELALGSSGSPLALLSDEDPFQALTAAAKEGTR